MNILKTGIVLLLFFNMLSNAQTTQTTNQRIIPPSPTAASLGLFGDIPVSTYTGIPDISVPIYSIESGTISLPINLSYYASGIKVAQESGWVGIGWALEAGGVITRIVCGYDDFGDSPKGFYYSDDILKEGTTSDYLVFDGSSGSTGANGDLQYYVSFNRLQNIKDKDGKIINTFDYNYQH